MDKLAIQFVLRKLLRMTGILVGVTGVAFLLIHAVPGSPWNNYGTSERAMVGISIDKATQRELDLRFGLNLPLWRQYTRYIIGDWDQQGKFFCGALCGNLGPSIQQRGRSVQSLLFSAPEGKTFWQSPFGYSTRLVLLAMCFAAGLGIPLGVVSATQPRSLISRFISLGLAALLSVPNFVLGLLSILVLASWLKIIKVLPDWNEPSHWIVPALVLALMPMASVARVAQDALVNILNEDYIRAARARGLTQNRVILVHGLRNAIVPILTFLGPTSMEILAGLFVVENLYAFPGFGREYWRAVLNLDYPLIMGLTLIYATGMLLINFGIETLCMFLDPRIRVQHRGAP